MAASWTEILDEMDEAERAAAQEAEDVATPGDDRAATGDDNVELGGDEIKSIWTGDQVLDKARFIPDLESKMTL